MWSLFVPTAVLVCLVQIMESGSAYHMKKRAHKGLAIRRRSAPSAGGATAPSGYIYFTENDTMPSETSGNEYQDVDLSCVASGVPQPSIHWLKNGEPISQKDCNCGTEELAQVGRGLGGTKSVLHLSCLDLLDEANYTCVAQTATSRISHTTSLKIVPSETPEVESLVKCAKKGQPARIYMSTDSLFGQRDEDARLFCRANGVPKPQITWFDVNNQPIHDSEHYKLESNGDLVIKKITFERNMGVYTCRAANDFGEAYVEPFLYPTYQDSRLQLW